MFAALRGLLGRSGAAGADVACRVQRSSFTMQSGPARYSCGNSLPLGASEPDGTEEAPLFMWQLAFPLSAGAGTQILFFCSVMLQRGERFVWNASAHAKDVGVCMNFSCKPSRFMLPPWHFRRICF